MAQVQEKHCFVSPAVSHDVLKFISASYHLRKPLENVLFVCERSWTQTDHTRPVWAAAQRVPSCPVHTQLYSTASQSHRRSVKRRRCHFLTWSSSLLFWPPKKSCELLLKAWASKRRSPSSLSWRHRLNPHPPSEPQQTSAVIRNQSALLFTGRLSWLNAAV